MVGYKDSAKFSAKLQEFYKDVEYVYLAFYRVLDYLGDSPVEWAEVLSALEDLSAAEIKDICETYKEIRNQA